MADGQNNDFNQPILNLTPQEKTAYAYLFKLADTDSLGVLTGERAITFFEKTHVPAPVLGEIWQIADTENRGLLTRPGFCMVMRLIGLYQSGESPRPELAFSPAPLPKFEGITIPGIETPGPPRSPTVGQVGSGVFQPQLSGQSTGGGPIRIPPLDYGKVQQYSSLFERSGAQNGLLDGGMAKSIFERSGLPNEMLGRIWMLSDREQRGMLDQTEFIVAMHLLTSIKTRAMTALPNTLPPGLYEAAARRGQRPPSRQPSGQVPVPRQLTGNQPPRTQSPLAWSAQATSGPHWLITAQEKAQYDKFFSTIDTTGAGVISGEQAVRFFSDSRLSDELLASIWDLADMNSAGQLSRDEFAVAMYLIRQQRQPNAPPLPAFLPAALVPPSMRGQQRQPQQSTAPAFDNPAAAPPSNIPKSAAEDLFGLDEPSAPQQQPLQPQTTGTSSTRDPFGSQPGSPSTAQRFQPQNTGPTNTTFKPFVPTSAFGASLAQNNTGGSATSSQASRAVPAFQQQAPRNVSSAQDDLLGDNEAHAAESSKITGETTELANMSSQIGNLRTQMEETQSKKSAAQSDLAATSAQKRDLEVRLQQFRLQYEAEVRVVKELEQQIGMSRESTKKLGQELALLEGTYQDLQTQHAQLAQALQADQSENANLKQRISQINAEVARLKPELEKMKMDARQQKGLVSINKKQLATNEAERDRLQSEKADLEREAAERATASPEPAQQNRELASPVGSAISSTNPFFRKSSASSATSPPLPTSSGPTPSAFDALFGPSSAFAPTGQTSSRSGTPPATSFIGRDLPSTSSALGAAGGGLAALTASNVVKSASVEGDSAQHAQTPTPKDQTKDSAEGGLPTPSQEPPAPPPNRQFTASNLPIAASAVANGSDVASSTKVVPPTSRVGELATPAESTTPVTDGGFVPGAFPTDDPHPSASADEPLAPSDQLTPLATQTPSGAKDEFDSAFADFGNDQVSKEADASGEQIGKDVPQRRPPGSGFDSEFPPIQNLEIDSDSDSDEEQEGPEDSFATAAQPSGTGQGEGSATEKSISASEPISKPYQADSPFDQLDNETQRNNVAQGLGVDGGASGTGAGTLPFSGGLTSGSPAAQHVLAKDITGTSTPDVFHEAPTQQSGSGDSKVTAPKNAFDDFDAFDDLPEAQEHRQTADGPELDFGRQSVDEFNPAFDSPSASMTNTPMTRSLQQSQDTTNGFANFAPNASTSSAFASSGQSGSIQTTPQNYQHDWDAIFSGLDNSTTDTSMSNSQDPWGAPPPVATTNGTASSPTLNNSVQSQTHPLARAITPGTEHDDPILKRLTGMGYQRTDAVRALEKYDYDINRAIDHLAGS